MYASGSQVLMGGGRGDRWKHLIEVGPGQATFNIKACVLFRQTLTEKKKRTETEFLVIFFFPMQIVFSKTLL